jgi:galactitol PTS system EIIA component
VIWEKLNRKLIKTGLEVSSKEDVFQELGSLFIKEGFCRESYIKALIDREKEYPTGLDIDGFGIAIPHTDVSHVIQPALAIAVLQNPVKFEIMGADEGEVVAVSIVVAMAIKEPSQHLDQVQALLKILQDGTVLSRMKQAKTAEEIVAIIQDKEVK